MTVARIPCSPKCPRPQCRNRIAGVDCVDKLFRIGRLRPTYSSASLRREKENGEVSGMYRGIFVFVLI